MTQLLALFPSVPLRLQLNATLSTAGRPFRATKVHTDGGPLNANDEGDLGCVLSRGCPGVVVIERYVAPFVYYELQRELLLSPNQ